MPSCFQAVLSKDMILWTLQTSEKQALPFICDRAPNTVSSKLYSPVLEKSPVLHSPTARLPVQSGPLDPLCVRPCQWTVREVLE